MFFKRTINLTFFFALAITFFNPLNVLANPPGIGDNSLLSCIEVSTRDEEDDVICKGNLVLLSQANKAKNGRRINTKQALKSLQISKRYFTARLNQAQKKNDTELIAEYESKLLNTEESRADITTCEEYIRTDCFQNLTSDIIDSCNVAADPENTNEDKQISFIIQGEACTTATKSPVVRLGSFCTGSLIAPDVVLTAAHCVYYKYTPERCDPFFTVSTNGGESRGGASCKIHPQYSNGAIRTLSAFHKNLRTDIALIFLDSPFTSEEANILKINTDNTKNGLGDSVVLAGYGTGSIGGLNATANVISKLRKHYISTKFYAWFTSSHSGADFSRGISCFGDSGGPLLSFIDGEWKTIGITSLIDDQDCGFFRGKANAYWVNVSYPGIQEFIKEYTDGILD